MSGHSHYATIHRQKEIKDAAKGKVFSKLARAISIAVKTGGGGSIDGNYKLRMAVDAARVVNMPKENIERAINRASAEAENLEEVSYEGFGPLGVAVIVEVTTDNRNRTGQEIKNLFERGGGSLGGPGSVSFNFEPRGLVVIRKTENVEEQMLKLIDAGIEDMEETEDGIECYTAPDRLSDVRKAILNEGFEIVSIKIVQKPKNYQVVSEPSSASKVLSFLDKIEEQDDVQNVYANIDIPEDTLKQISSEN